MAPPCFQGNPAQRASLTTPSSRAAPIRKVKKSVLSKVKLVVAPPSRIPCFIGETSTLPAVYPESAIAEWNTFQPSKDPRLIRSTKSKRASILKKCINLQSVLSPDFSVSHGYGDPFHPYREASDRDGSQSTGDLVQKPVIGRPIELVKKRRVTPAQTDESPLSPDLDTYSIRRDPVSTIKLNSMTAGESIGLLLDHCITGPRYRAPKDRNAHQTLDSTQAHQPSMSTNDHQPSDKNPKLSMVVPRPRTSTLSSMTKRSIRKLAASVLRPTGQHCARISFRVDKEISYHITQRSPTLKAHAIRKPTLKFPSAKKAYRPVGSFPPISGLRTPDKFQSAHGICQLRRRGEQAKLVCVCYKKFWKSRQGLSSHAPALLSDIMEEQPVAFFPRRRSLSLDVEARRLLFLSSNDEADDLPPEPTSPSISDEPRHITSFFESVSPPCVGSFSFSSDDAAYRDSLIDDYPEYLFSPILTSYENLESDVILPPLFSPDIFSRYSNLPSEINSVVSVPRLPQSVTFPDTHDTTSSVHAQDRELSEPTLPKVTAEASLSNTGHLARILSTSFGLGFNVDDYNLPSVDSNSNANTNTNSPAVAPISSLSRLKSDFSSTNGTTVAHSQETGDDFVFQKVLPSSVSSTDVEEFYSPRAAVYANHLPIGVALPPPSRRISLYGSTSPRMSLPVAMVQHRSSGFDRPNSMTPKSPTSLGLSESIAWSDLQHPSLRRISKASLRGEFTNGCDSSPLSSWLRMPGSFPL